MHCIGEGYGAVSECRALGRSTPKVPLRAGRAPGRAANGRNGKAPDHQTLSMLHQPLQIYSHHQRFSLLLHIYRICSQLHEYKIQSSLNPYKVMFPVTLIISKGKGPKRFQGELRWPTKYTLQLKSVCRWLVAMHSSVSQYWSRLFSLISTFRITKQTPHFNITLYLKLNCNAAE